MADEGIVRILKEAPHQWEDAVRLADNDGLPWDTPITIEYVDYDKEAPGRVTITTTKRAVRDRDFTDADLRGADLRGLDLSQAHFDGAIMSQVRADGTNFRGSTFQRADLRNAALAGANFDDGLVGNLSRDTDEGSLNWTLTDAGMEARARRQQLKVATLAGATITGAVLTAYGLGDIELRGALADGTTVFPPRFDPVAAGVRFVEDDPSELGPIVFTARIEQPDQALRGVITADVEPLLNQAELLLASDDIDSEAELNLRSAVGVVRNELASTQADSLILERSILRLAGIVASHIDRAELAEAVGVAEDGRGDFAVSFDGLLDAAGQVGVEDPTEDAANATTAADRYEGFVSDLPPVHVSVPVKDEPTAEPPVPAAVKEVPRLKRASAWLAEQRKVVIKGAATAAGSAAVTTAIAHHAQVIRAAHAVLQALESVFKLFT